MKNLILDLFYNFSFNFKKIGLTPIIITALYRKMINSFKRNGIIL